MYFIFCVILHYNMIALVYDYFVFLLKKIWTHLKCASTASLSNVRTWSGNWLVKRPNTALMYNISDLFEAFWLFVPTPPDPLVWISEMILMVELIGIMKCECLKIWIQVHKLLGPVVDCATGLPGQTACMVGHSVWDSATWGNIIHIFFLPHMVPKISEPFGYKYVHDLPVKWIS